MAAGWHRAVVVGLLWAAGAPAAEPGGTRIAVTFPASLAAEPAAGRLLLLLSTDDTAEPRFQISDTAQALLHRYETFRRADGHVVQLPMDRGEGQQWNRAPGNLYSTPKKLALDPARPGTVRIELCQVIPAVVPPADTRWIKHVRLRSELLSKFWGRDMYLGAQVLLPAGFDDHPDARYPLVIDHGHFPADFDGFREQPPDRDLKPDYSARFKFAGYNRIVQQADHQLYEDWTGPGFPRFLLIQIQHANPYYDDSYAVNSQNLGPYGDAIVRELIPHIERKYRGLGQGWARFMYGGSTGGWEALAAQVLYPDEFNGCYAACPDPIDFRHYVTTNLYVGDMDNYYLNNAAYAAEEFLESTRNPPYGGEVAYGDRAEHCWNGDPTRPNALSRLRYPQMFAPKIVERMLQSAPAGADLTSWRY